MHSVILRTIQFSLSILSLTSVAGFHASAQNQQLFAVLNVHNTLSIARPDEVIAIPLRGLQKLNGAHAIDPRHLAVRAADSDTWLPVQIYDSQNDGMPNELLVQVTLAPRQKQTLRIYTMTTPPEFPSQVYARLVPERMDDFAWENMTVAYRVYGPALEATGEITSGIDVWSKRPPRFVINDWYKRDHNSQEQHKPELSYHLDNGTGQDSYDVGKTPGCGGTGVWNGSESIPSKNVTVSHITAMGPIRLRFSLDYAPWQAGGARVTEHKIITLDAGSHMNHVEAHYDLQGANSVVIAAGLAVHKDAEVQHQNSSLLSVWDTPQLISAGRIATGLVVPKGEHPTFAQTSKAIYALLPVSQGATIYYDTGAGWSKADMPEISTWQTYLQQYRQRLDAPIRWKLSRYHASH